MNIWGILLVVLGVIVVVGLFQQGGWSGFSNAPIQSSWEASKTIGEKTMDTYQWSKDKIQGTSSDSLKNLGLPLCKDDLSCQSLSECKIGNCTCDLSSGNCFLQT